MGYDIKNHQAIFDATAGGNLVAQDDLFAVVVHARSEDKFAGAFTRIASHQGCRCCARSARLKNSPAGETTRYFLHVLLCVSAIDAESMQLHQLACVIFVDAAPLLLLLWSLLLWVVAHAHQLGQWATPSAGPLLR